MSVFAVDMTSEDRECLIGLRMIAEAFDEYQPISMFDDYMYEAFGKKKNAAENEHQNAQPQQPQTNATKQQMEKNDAAAAKASSGLKKVIDSVLAMIKRLKDAIVDFFERRKLDEEERKAMNALEEAMRKDPSLKNKKITVADFRKVQGEYEAITKEIEKEITKCKNESYQPSQELTNRIKRFLKHTKDDLVTSVSSTALVNMAGVGPKQAKIIRGVLDNNEELCNSLRDKMGDRNFKAMNRQVRGLSHHFSWRRLYMQVTGRYYEDILSATEGAINGAKSLCGFKSNEDNTTIGNKIAIANNIRRGQSTGAAIDTVVGTAVAGAKAGAKDKTIQIAKAAVAKKPENLSTSNVYFLRRQPSVRESIFSHSGKPRGHYFGKNKNKK